MSSVSLTINLTVALEGFAMITAILVMCLAAGTALLGRSGDMFPKPGEAAYRIKMSTVCGVGESAGGYWFNYC